MSFKLPLQEKDILLINKNSYIFCVLRKTNEDLEKMLLPRYELMFTGLSIQSIEPVLSFVAENLNLKLARVKNFQDLEKDNFIYQLIQK